MQFEYHGHIINLLDTLSTKIFLNTCRVLTAVDRVGGYGHRRCKRRGGANHQALRCVPYAQYAIITFINKMDREVREPFELLEEIESVLKIECAPVTWPLGMGKAFRGVYHLQNDEVLRFAPGERRSEAERIAGLNNPVLDESYPMEVPKLREDVSLIQEASPV